MSRRRRKVLENTVMRTAQKLGHLNYVQAFWDHVRNLIETVEPEEKRAELLERIGPRPEQAEQVK